MVGAEVNTGAEFVHFGQMVAPVAVDGGQNGVALELPHDVLAVGSLLLRVDHHDRLEDIFTERLAAQLGDIFRFELQIQQIRLTELLGEGAEVPVLRIPIVRAVFIDIGIEDVFDQFQHFVLDRFPLQGGQPALVDPLALDVHHVVVFQRVLADGEVLGLDFLLGSFDGFGDHAVGDDFPFFHTEAIHDAAEPIAAEQAHEIILQRQEEDRGAGVPLTAGPSA